MSTPVYWLGNVCPWRLGVAARPRGGDWLEGDLRAWQKDGVQLVLSALCPDEEKELQLLNEGQLCRQVGMEFYSTPLPDRCVPSSMWAWHNQFEDIRHLLTKSAAIIAHCRMGIGRATIVAASLMIEMGISAEQALQWIEKARQQPIPDTREQRRWLVAYEQFFKAQKNY